MSSDAVLAEHTILTYSLNVEQMMTQAATTGMTFQEYLHYDDGTDKHYEFEGGQLIEMPPESPLNS